MGTAIEALGEESKKPAESVVTSYWDPYAMMIVQLKPEEAIKELRNATSQMNNNLTRMDKTNFRRRSEKSQ
jgi:hypothetical protein